MANTAENSCVSFHGSHFMDQTLVIRQGMDFYCQLNRTTKIGETVPCESNATAKLVNETCVVLQTQEGPNKYILEYGSNNERGKVAQGLAAFCPTLSDDTTTVSPMTESRSTAKILCGVFGGILLILIIVAICHIYKCYHNRTVNAEKDVERNEEAKDPEAKDPEEKDPEEKDANTSLLMTKQNIPDNDSGTFTNSAESVCSRVPRTHLC